MIKNIFIIIIIILLWLLSRKISFVPFFIWDILRWMMMFFIVNIFYKEVKKAFFISLFICFFIEFSQLLNFEVLINIRETKLWWLLLWKWFLISDLFCYILWNIFWYFLYKSIKTKK